MTLKSSFAVALRKAALGAGVRFLVSACLAMMLIVVGRAAGIDAHPVYGPVLLIPFLLAASSGTAAIATLRHRMGAGLTDADVRGVVLAAFAWNLICLAIAAAMDWAASRAGLLGRAPNGLVDSIGMVLAISIALTTFVALSAGQKNGSNGA